VKLTIGPLFGNLNGAMRRCLANRLLARALISGHVVRMFHAAFANQNKIIDVGGYFPPRAINLPLNHLPIISRKRHSSLCITGVVSVYRLVGFDENNCEK
jgi:hypothetical protein